MRTKRNSPPELVQLNTEQTAIFRSLTEGVAYRKIHVDGYIDLTIEFVCNRTLGKLTAMDYSLCHYSEQNGDLMRDPEMCFLVLTDSEGEWHVYGHYYRNDLAFGYESESILFEETPKVKRKMQKDQMDFARIWINNLKEQGFVKAAKEQPIDEKLEKEESNEAEG